MLLLELLHLLECLVQRFLGIGALLLCLLGKCLGLVRFDCSLFLLLCHHSLLLLSVQLVALQTLHELDDLLVFLFQLGLHLPQLDLHLLDLPIG